MGKKFKKSKAYQQTGDAGKLKLLGSMGGSSNKVSTPPNTEGEVPDPPNIGENSGKAGGWLSNMKKTKKKKKGAGGLGKPPKPPSLGGVGKPKKKKKGAGKMPIGSTIANAGLKKSAPPLTNPSGLSGFHVKDAEAKPKTQRVTEATPNPELASAGQTQPSLSGGTSIDKKEKGSLFNKLMNQAAAKREEKKKRSNTLGG